MSDPQLSEQDALDLHNILHFEDEVEDLELEDDFILIPENSENHFCASLLKKYTATVITQ